MISVLSESRHHWYATSDDTLLLYWRGEITMDSIVETQAATHHVRRLNPGGVRVIAMIEGDTRLPDGTVRQRGAEIDAEVGGCLLCHATVLAGEGFWAAAGRAGLGAIFTISRTQYPRKVYRSAGEAMAWQLAYGLGDKGQATLLERLDAIRAQPDPAQAADGD